jgi:hypothetical protein
MLMPSVPVTEMLPRLQHAGYQLTTPGVLDACHGDRLDRRRVVEHLQQHCLQDATAPTGSQQSSVRDRRDDISRTAHGGQP